MYLLLAATCLVFWLLGMIADVGGGLLHLLLAAAGFFGVLHLKFGNNSKPE